MGSSRAQDRSLNETTFLPQWMKGKMESRFDFDESSFSPPSHDDGFFIRYVRSKPVVAEKSNFRGIDNVLQDNRNSTTPGTNNGGPELKNIKDVDFSKHPAACQAFIPSASNKSEIKVQKATVAGSQAKLKSQGTADGFHGESALCGKSIVQVANEMMSNTFVRSNDAAAAELSLKKGSSKSLPATPLTSPISTPDSSPKSRRRLNSNRYFTGAFIPDREKSGWILAGILGQSRELVNSKIEEEEEEESTEIPTPRIIHRKKSISSQNLTYIGKEDEKVPKVPTYTHVLQPKPSEFREMNFWSPTSM